MTEELGGKMVVAELRPGGKNMPVTNENKLQYVHAMADYKLNRQVCCLFNLTMQDTLLTFNQRLFFKLIFHFQFADSSFCKCIL